MFEVERSFTAPEGLLQLPRVESGAEIFEVTIPEGLQLSLVDLATPEASAMASAELASRPARGATGRHSLRINWSHPVPMGAVRFRLRVYASPDGTPPPINVPITEPGVERRTRLLVEQDAPVDMAVEGPLVQVFHDQILARGGEIGPLQDPAAAGLSRPFDAGVISGPTAAVIISLAVIAAICIAIGLAAFAAVLFFALSKGYNVENAGYTVAVGEGKSRQEHQMVFNLRQPGT